MKLLHKSKITAARVTTEFISLHKYASSDPDFLLLWTEIVRVSANISYLWFWNSITLEMLETKESP